MESECVGIFRKALEESSRDFSSFATLDMDSKKKLYKNLGNLYSEVRVKCENRLGPEMAKTAKANLKLAQLKIAMSIRDSLKKSDNRDIEAMDMISSFSDDEYEAITRLEHFSTIDSLSSESIKTLLKTSDNQIYKLIKEWYNTNMDNFLSSVTIFSEGKVNPEIRFAMEERYRTRFQKITEGIISFIQSDPRQLRKLFDDYERELKLSMELHVKREDVETRLRELISGETMSSLRDRVMEATSLLKNRDFKALHNMEINSLLSQLKSVQATVENGIKEIQLEKVKLLESRNSGSEDGFQDLEIKRIDATVNDLKIKIESDILSNIGTLEVIKGVLESSSKYGEDNSGQEYVCTGEDVRLREVSFFESLDYIFNKDKLLTLTNPITGENLNIELRQLVNKRRESELQIPESEGEYTSRTKSLLYRYQRDKLFRSGTRLSMAFIFNVSNVSESNREAAKVLDIYRTPFSNVDLARIMGVIIENASMEDSYVIAVIGSPNGFERSVIEQVRNHKGVGIQSRRFSIILMDLRTGELTAGDNDVQALQITEVMRNITGKSGNEEINKIKKATEDELSIAGISRLGSIAKITEGKEANVLEVWAEMEKAKIGTITKVQGERVFRKK